MRELLKKVISNFENFIFYRMLKSTMFSSHLNKIFSSGYFNSIKKPKVKEIRKKSKVLILCPHPDDETIAMGGTIIKEKNIGSDLSVIYCTQKENSIRANEAKKLCFENKISHKFLGFDDHDIEINPEIINSIDTYIKKKKPDKIYLPFFFDDHDDHKRSVELIYNYFLKNKDSKIEEIWCYQVYGVMPATHIIDITSEVKKKEKLINYYKSVGKKRNWSHWILGSNAFQSRFINAGPKKAFAESYLFFEIEQFLKLCKIYFKNKSVIYNNRRYRD
tara:strand:+ start:52 stop:879 length:828 start_codon:yes stop_codon:yes gene_type:complete